MQAISDIKHIVKRAAAEAGFELAGVAGVGGFAELDYFPEWMVAGHACEMNYLLARNEAGELKRSSLRSVAPWARSIVVCAMNYNAAQPYSIEVSGSQRGWISRYAWSIQDYHKLVLQRLTQVEKTIHETA